MNHVLGIDFGGVIMTHSDRRSADTPSRSDFLDLPPIDGAFEALIELGERKFERGNIHIVSRVDDNIMASMVLGWLKHHRFHDTTGIRGNNVHFCLKREDKAPICEMRKVDTFVDDRLEVLSHLTMVKTRFLLDPRPDEVEQFHQHLSGVHMVQSWRDILSHLLP